MTHFSGAKRGATKLESPECANTSDIGAPTLNVPRGSEFRRSAQLGLTEPPDRPVQQSGAKVPITVACDVPKRHAASENPQSRQR
tara:strand:+ start:2041 stop:2295 length:255 start_codon:yes stop_codon:yes gene_type:complete